MAEKIRLTSEEQELMMNKTKDGWAEIYCSWDKYIAILKEYAKDYPDDYEIIREDEISITVKVNPKHIGFNKPYRKK